MLPQTKNHSKNMTHATNSTVNTIGTIRRRQPFHILLNSGSSCCLIKQSCLSRGDTPKDLCEKKLSEFVWPNMSSLCVTPSSQSLIKIDALLNRKLSSSIMTPVGMIWLLAQISFPKQESNLIMTLITYSGMTVHCPYVLARDSPLHTLIT